MELTLYKVGAGEKDGVRQSFVVGAVFCWSELGGVREGQAK